MLNNFFEPKSIAIIGASRTPGKLGYDLLENIIKGGYQGKIYPVNPGAEEVLGRKAYPSVSNIADEVDLAIIIIPAVLVAKALEECGQKGITAAIIISAGFKETGEAGKKLEADLVAIAQKYNIKILGPNCLGVTNPSFNLNATFTKNLPPAGNVAFVSQSGALISTILSASSVYGLGFSKIISIGNKAMLDEVDFLNYLENDPKTEVIMLYLESIARGRAFIEAGKTIAIKKPIIVLKAGVSERAAKSVMSHTGALAGKDEIISAALKEVNVLRVKNLYKFIFLAKSFSVGKLPKNNRIAIITNAGGMGVLASDRISATKLALAEISENTRNSLKEKLPLAAGLGNPFDIIGDAKTERYRAAIEGVLADENVDGAVIILTPQTMTEKEETAKLAADFSKKTEKPIIGVFSGGQEMDEAKKILAGANIINFDTPEVAIEMMNILWEYKEKTEQMGKERSLPLAPAFMISVANKNKIKNILEKTKMFEVLSLRAERSNPMDNAEASGLLRRSTPRNDKAYQVSLPDAFKILKAYSLPVIKSELAKDEKDLLRAAKKIGYPVAIKAFSQDIVHKAKTGAVAVNIKTPAELKAQYKKITTQIRKADKTIKISGFIVQAMAEKGAEIIVGGRQDLQFGATVMVGLGGVYTEIFKDVAWGIAPISKATAKNMVNELKSKAILPENSMDKICEALVKVSAILTDFPEIQELDINPLFVSEKKIVAVDARMIL